MVRSDYTLHDLRKIYLEVSGHLVVLLPRQRHTFNDSMLLPLERDDGFIEENTFIVFSEHPHQRFHEVLFRSCMVNGASKYGDLGMNYLDFVPNIVVPFQHCKVMLYRYFAGEIIGNVLDLQPRQWRRPRRVDSQHNRRRVTDFKKSFDKYDWTGMIGKS